MTDNRTSPQAPTGRHLAALKNVVSMMSMATRLMDRGPHLPGIGVMHGYSGYGKTYSAIYLVNKLRCPRVEIGDSWTKKTLLSMILRELGERQPRGTIPALAEQAVQHLSQPGHPPLIIDEADKLADKGMVEIIREIHEASQVPIILVGEEVLPHKLERWERAHNRVLEWTAAQPCDLEDTRKLADVFTPRLTLADDLLDLIREQSHGKARRIVTNLDRLRVWATETGQMVLDRASYGGGFQPVSAPPRRSGRAA